MIVVTGTIDLAPESWEPACEAARIMAEATRAEPGCQAYGFYADIEQPHRLRIYEEWETAEALAAHFSMPHIATFLEKISALTVLGREIHQFEAGARTAL